MKNRTSFRHVFVAAALLALPAACKDNVREAADQAAETVTDKTEDLREEREELSEEVSEQREEIAEGARARDEHLRRDDSFRETRDRAVNRLDDNHARETAKDISEQAHEVNEKAVEVANVADEFAQRRQLRISELRSVHGVIASQPMLLTALVGMTPLTDRARADVNEKLQVFQMRLDETGNAIEALQGVGPEDWEARHDEAAQTKDRLEDARDAAWEALTDGDRIGSS
ncbi:MAG: hypothetical protein H0X17_15380 [Deltaproteobacteria bacterium]|nr:hypothetical protein [Deltaproteobacteria bacterium]